MVVVVGTSVAIEELPLCGNEGVTGDVGLGVAPLRTSTGDEVGGVDVVIVLEKINGQLGRG